MDQERRRAACNDLLQFIIQERVEKSTSYDIHNRTHVFFSLSSHPLPIFFFLSAVTALDLTRPRAPPHHCWSSDKQAVAPVSTHAWLPRNNEKATILSGLHFGEPTLHRVLFFSTAHPPPSFFSSLFLSFKSSCYVERLA